MFKSGGKHCCSAESFCLFSAKAHSVFDASSLTNFTRECYNSECEFVYMCVRSRRHHEASLMRYEE